MAPDTAQDKTVLRVMDKLLEHLSIRTTVCMTPSGAQDLLREHAVDLVVVDSEDDGAVPELLREIWSSMGRRKPTTVVVTERERPAADAHVVLRKPLTTGKAEQSFRTAYSNMVKDYRKHARCAVMSCLVAKDQSDRPVRMTITDINRGGVGICTKEKLAVGDLLDFDLLLPETNKVIHLEIRVLWTRPHGVAGGEFSRVLPRDVNILRHWLETRYRIKGAVACG